MKLSKPIVITLVLLAAQLSAWSAEVALLRNGFSIRFERKEQKGDVTRLYTRGGFVEVPSADIASFDHDDTPDLPAPQPDQQAPPAAQSAAAMGGSTTPVPAQGPTAAKPALSRAELEQFVRETSSRYRLDPDFVMSVIKAESNFQARAVSRKGAQGLMQLMPETSSQLGVADPFDPKANVAGGTAFLNQLLEQYHDDPQKALAAYNAGAHRVEQYHGVPPYRETRAYIAFIIRDFNAKKRAQMNAAAAAQGRAPGSTKLKKKSSPVQPQEADVTKPAKPA
jgi:soluble lytic murein transglycosylase-like protein